MNLFTKQKQTEKANLRLPEWDRKMCYTCAMEHYSVITRNEMLPFATPWMKLKGVILSERCQTKQTKTICYHLCGI